MGSGERGASVHFPPPLVFVSTTLAAIALRYAGLPSNMPGASLIRVPLGTFILLSAIVLVASARNWFVRTGQRPTPWTPSPELIFEGPYRFTRNPMYLGMTLVQLGLGTILGNFWIALFALPSLLLVHFIAVRPEERYLSSKFGKPYDDYRSRVRRYL
jgi:protein-S-isoprenylcysteine O-methyltransferase Ste14